MVRLARSTVLTGLALLTLTACSEPPHDYVAGDSEEFPRILFADADVSANDRCPVKKNKLNRSMDPVFVNGEPVGFC
jgi:hypothetical protein